ncbi:MAG: putative Ig domain-containing protein [Planctomycetaceae bacterium]
MLLAKLNQVPEFTTTARTEVIAGEEYSYDSDAVDPDNDTLTYSLISGPTGLTIDRDTGLITWTTSLSDANSYESVTIQAEDPYGGQTTQEFVIHVRDTVANRPPRFTSIPVIDAYVGIEYTYQATAFDPDGDTLLFSGYDIPGGDFTVGTDGAVTWTPTAEDIDQYFDVELQVEDGNGGSARQAYQIRVHANPANHDPIIISDPQTVHHLPTPSNVATGTVTPELISLLLGEGETEVQPVFYTSPIGELSQAADIVFVVDESGSMDTEHEWLGEMINQLESNLTTEGIAPNYYGLVGYLATGRAITSSDTYRIRLYDNNNNLVEEKTVNATYSSPDITLPTDGTYTIVVDAPGQSGLTNTSYILKNVVDVPVVTSGLNVDYSGTINAGESVTANFAVSAGHEIYVDTIDVDDAAVVYDLVHESGKVVFSGKSASTNSGVISIPRSGNYTLTVRGADSASTGDYSLRLVDLETVTTIDTSLSAGTQSGTLETGYEAEYYQFTGNVGDLLNLDSYSTGTDTAVISLVSPSGNILLDNIDANSDSGLVVLPESGTFLVVVENSSAVSADYEFKLGDLSTAASISMNSTISGSFDTVAKTNIVKFDATAEDLILFDVTSRSGAANASWELLSPYGTSLFSGEFSSATTSDQTAFTLWDLLSPVKGLSAGCLWRYL